MNDTGQMINLTELSLLAVQLEGPICFAVCLDYLTLSYLLQYSERIDIRNLYVASHASFVAYLFNSKITFQRTPVLYTFSNKEYFSYH